MGFFRQVAGHRGEGLRAELRTKEAINASLAFALVILLLFSFAFDPTEETTREISGGLLWIVFAFAGALVLNRSFRARAANDCLDALIAAPISGAALFLGKAMANFLLVTGSRVGLFAGFRHLLQCAVDLAIRGTHAGAGAGHLGVTVIGTIFSALTVNIRLREVMLPMLTYPILVPALLGAMQLTTGAGGRQADRRRTRVAWLKMLIGFDVILHRVSLVLVETVPGGMMYCGQDGILRAPVGNRRKGRLPIRPQLPKLPHRSWDAG